MKNLIAVATCLLFAIVIVIVPSFLDSYSQVGLQESMGVFHQDVVGVSVVGQPVYKLYEDDKLVGIIDDKRVLDQHLDDIYQDKYASMFPDSHLNIGKNMYLVEELSHVVYQDVDDQIMDYLDQQNAYTIACKAISFSDQQGEYARIFVKSKEIYENALQKYLGYFVDEDTLQAINNHKRMSDLTGYGDMTVGYKINENIQISDAYASEDEIKMDEESVLRYLSYGDNENLEYYTTVEGDTLASIGLHNYGLTASQLLLINQDIVTDISMPLPVGTKICITYFTSPIDVYVYKQSLRKEDIFYDTSIVEDSTVPQGQTIIRQAGANGSKNVFYDETWVNGVLEDGKEISSVITANKQDELIASGSGSGVAIGTGSFAYPTDNPQIICNYGCYAGFESVDFINRYNRWGNILAVDNGEVSEKGYDDELGYYIMIDHHNGYTSIYGHLFVESPLEVGTNVKKGDVIGMIGMSGAATGPHVTFQLLQNGESINACQVLMNCEGLSR